MIVLSFILLPPKSFKQSSKLATAFFLLHCSVHYKPITETSIMSVNLHILQASGRLEPFEQTIRKAADEAIGDVKKAIDLPDVDITVFDHPEKAIDETGVGGRIMNKHYVRIAVDPEHDNVQENLAPELKSSIAHELNHASRWHTVGKATTLLESFVEEGLAVHFTIEITGCDPKPWCTAVQGERLEELKERARDEFDNEDYDYYGWFFGYERDDIPKWAGYSIAYLLVGDYLEKTGKSAAELTDKPAEIFVE